MRQFLPTEIWDVIAAMLGDPADECRMKIAFGDRSLLQDIPGTLANITEDERFNYSLGYNFPDVPKEQAKQDALTAELKKYNRVLLIRAARVFILLEIQTRAIDKFLKVYLALLDYGNVFLFRFLSSASGELPDTPIGISMEIDMALSRLRVVGEEDNRHPRLIFYYQFASMVLAHGLYLVYTDLDFPLFRQAMLECFPPGKRNTTTLLPFLSSISEFITTMCKRTVRELGIFYYMYGEEKALPVFLWMMFTGKERPQSVRHFSLSILYVSALREKRGQQSYDEDKKRIMDYYYKVCNKYNATDDEDKRHVLSNLAWYPN